MTTRRRIAILLAAGLFAATALAQDDGPQAPPELSPAEKDAERKARLKLAADGLAKLYAVQPDRKSVV